MNTRKIITLLLVLLLCISLLPGVLARQHPAAKKSSIEATDKLDNVNKDVAEKRKQEKERIQALKEKKEMRTEKKQEFKQEIKEKRQEQKQRLEEFKAKRDEVRSKCREEEKDDEECKRLRKESRENATKFLDTTSQRLITLLEKLKSRIENSKLSDEAKTRLSTEVEQSVSKVNSVVGRVNALGENAKKEDIKNAAKELRTIWKDVNQVVHKSTNRLTSERFGGILVKTEHLNTKLSKILDRLKSKGVDTSQLNSKLSDFKSKIEEVNSLHQEVKTLIESNDEGSIKQATEKMKLTHQKLKEANNVLREILTGLKESKEGREALEANTPEATTT